MYTVGRIRKIIRIIKARSDPSYVNEYSSYATQILKLKNSIKFKN